MSSSFRRELAYLHALSERLDPPPGSHLRPTHRRTPARTKKGKGVVILQGEKIVKFVEKPNEDIPGGLINSGIYILSPRIFDYIPEGFSDFGKEIFPKILDLGEKLYGFEIGEVIDIGTLEDLEEAKKLLSQK